jgi:hypothetical protein
MAKRIRVSEKVFAAIWSLSTPDLKTEDAILENSLRAIPECKPLLDTTTHDAAHRQRGQRSTSAMRRKPKLTAHQKSDAIRRFYVSLGRRRR